MKEKTLIKLSFIIMICGILILIVYATQIQLDAITQIEDIKPQETVRMQGTITKVTKMDTVTFLTVEGTRSYSTKVIFFPEKDTYIKEGQFVELEGVVEEYEGEKEVIAHSIEVK